MRGNYLQLICIVATVVRCHSVFDWYNLRARTHVLTNLSMLNSIAHSRCTLHTKYRPTGITMSTETEPNEEEKKIQQNIGAGLIHTNTHTSSQL